jgi:hypothetical protein
MRYEQLDEERQIILINRLTSIRRIRRNAVCIEAGANVACRRIIIPEECPQAVLCMPVIFAYYVEHGFSAVHLDFLLLTFCWLWL